MRRPDHFAAKLRAAMTVAGLAQVQRDRHAIATMVGQARNLADAERAAEELQSAGYETDVRSVSDDETFVYASEGES